MNKSSAIYHNESVTKQDVIDEMLSDIEMFRTEASRAYCNFSLEDRALLNSIETANLSSQTFLSRWQDSLKPKFDSLTKNKSDKAFSALLTKTLMLDSVDVHLKVDEIINERQQEIINDFLFKLYPITIKGKTDLLAKPRSVAKNLINSPDTVIVGLKSRQANYYLYKDVAEQHNITVIDLPDSFFKRLRSKSRIKKERKKERNYNKQRFHFVNNKLKLLSSMHDGIIVQVYEMQLDLVSIFDLRHQYEKKLGKLPESEQASAIKRLAIYTSVSEKYIAEQAERLSSSSSNTSLESIRKLMNIIDTILLRIFDLSNADKNELLLYTKDYRDLIKELSTLNKSMAKR